MYRCKTVYKRAGLPIKSPGLSCVTADHYSEHLVKKIIIFLLAQTSITSYNPARLCCMSHACSPRAHVPKNLYMITGPFFTKTPGLSQEPHNHLIYKHNKNCYLHIPFQSPSHHDPVVRPLTPPVHEGNQNADRRPKTTTELADSKRARTQLRTPRNRSRQQPALPPVMILQSTAITS